MPTVREVIKHLKTYNLDTHVACPIWVADDVCAFCEDGGFIEPTDEECNQVIDDLDRHHDACLGITWDAIEACLPDRVLSMGKDQ